MVASSHHACCLPCLLPNGCRLVAVEALLARALSGCALRCCLQDPRCEHGGKWTAMVPKGNKQVRHCNPTCRHAALGVPHEQHGRMSRLLPPLLPVLPCCCALTLCCCRLPPSAAAGHDVAAWRAGLHRRAV